LETAAVSLPGAHAGQFDEDSEMAKSGMALLRVSTSQHNDQLSFFALLGLRFR